MQINLISDTITLPSIGMRQAMADAEVGDDVFGQDPTVNRLQSILADMFDKEAAIFCPSGTMSNQMAIKVHTDPLDEMICDIDSHVYQYETGGYAFNSSIAVNLIHGQNGKVTLDQIKGAIKDVHDWLPISKLVVLENSTNKGGGNYYTLDEMKAISHYCREKSLKLHLDGARLFNVLVETNDSTKEIGQLFDSISICLSKGLGAPVGSVLIANKKDIDQARRFRKVMGGGMRQAGILAAAGIYALEHNIQRLKEDNDRAKRIGAILDTCNYVDHVMPVRTNIVIFGLKDRSSSDFVKALEKHGVSSHPFGPKKVRFVTHMHFDDEQLDELEKVLRSME